ncbi:MAG: phosphopantetheine adenylyltransferase [Gammaproteobacteria bacterium]
MHEKILTAVLIFVGIVHVLPASGVLGMRRLASLYAISVTNPNTEILLRHRAVLFGLLGLFLIYSAFQPALQGIALLAAFISLVSFIWLVRAIGGYNSKVRSVLLVDVVALLAVLIGIAICFLGDR